MKIAVLGSGNGAHAVAFEWARAGHDVYMFDFDMFPKPIAAINAAGGITSEGEMEGFQKLAYAGHDIGKVVTDADLIFAVGPAYSTEPFGKACAPYVKDGQIYIICPSSCMGAVTFKRALGLALDDNRVTISETSTLPYAVRIVGDAHIAVYNRLPGGIWLATLPSCENDRIHAMLSPIYPGLAKAKTVLQTSLQNSNPMLHPTITTLNAARIEQTHGDFFFYEEGVTPAVGNVLEAIDKERIAIAAALGLEVLSDPVLGVLQGYMTEANYVSGYNYAPGFKGIRAQSQLDYRYYNEDAGYGLVFWIDLASRVNVPVPNMKAMLQLVSTIMQRDYAGEGARTLEKIGLGDCSLEDLKAL